MRLTLLLGAGASIGAGVPGVATITDRLLDPSRATLQGGRFYFHDEPPDPVRFAPFAYPVVQYTDFLGRLKEIADSYYGKFEGDRIANYEDIVYFAQQIEDAIGFEYENPALAPLIEQFAPSGDYEALSDLRDLAAKSVDYAYGLVTSMLQDKGLPLDYLAPLYDAFEDSRVVQLDVGSLNHDLVIDRGLRERRISASDGFEEDWGTLHLWSDTYAVPTRRLFKLHGSIDWFRYDLDLGGWSGQVSARRKTGTDAWHPKGPDGTNLGARGYPLDDRPQFLAGTFNKILAYPTGVYADQHARFHDSLCMLVVGYGFRDKAINARLIAWMTTPRARRRMVVVDPNAERLRETSRPAVGSKVTSWIASGSAVAIPKMLEETSWDELCDALAGDWS